VVNGMFLYWTLGESNFRRPRQRNSSTLPILAQPSQNPRVAGVIRRRPLSSAFTTSWATRGQHLGRGGPADGEGRDLGWRRRTACPTPELRSAIALAPPNVPDVLI
jgi:hypothetical protein